MMFVTIAAIVTAINSALKLNRARKARRHEM